LKNSYLTAGISLPNYFRLLRRNKISCRPKYLLRAFFLFQSSLWSSLFALLEHLSFHKKIRNTPVPANPVFIIGHWRTGSTFLHQLMNLDDNLHAPTLFQVAIPDSFLSSYKYYRPLLNKIVEKHRPMDMVRLGMDEPQEDEYAIYRTTCYSPIERLVFPRDSRFFLLERDLFVPQEKQLPDWEKKLTWFFRKLSYKSGKTIVSKNPFNSFRIPELIRLFPKARFIHIYRDPCDIVPSSIHMWDIVQRQNCMNDLGKMPCIDDVITLLDDVWTAIQRDKELLPENAFYELPFEKLEADPMRELKKLYAALNLEFTEELGQKVISYLSELDGFRKNSFQLTIEEREKIRSRLATHMNYYGYK
jgi:omega-hydroxy-beta-dihydromenaquinone-9 sulfotransferase